MRGDHGKRYKYRVCRGTGSPECSPAKGKVSYLPMFHVKHPQKQSVRLVHDGAALHQGVCINSVLLQGPDLNNNLRGMLMRFHEHPVAFIADVEACSKISASAETRGTTYSSSGIRTMTPTNNWWSIGPRFTFSAARVHQRLQLSDYGSALQVSGLPVMLLPYCILCLISMSMTGSAVHPPQRRPSISSQRHEKSYQNIAYGCIKSCPIHSRFSIISQSQKEP